MLDKFKQLYQLQKQARGMQKELKDTEIEAQGSDGRIIVVLNGELKVQKVSIDPSLLGQDRQRELEKGLEQTFGEALHRAQSIAAEKSREMMKAMNIDIPGL